ncbi:hypothetical protein PSTT_11884 [Puccinia striiformis]|uniref:Golgi apparatus membrane protein TVP38 n=1 Tax=Puccinia striiformis TaxID=27350 RepID=A0A2S4UYP6_9BASI|nr:hypothetical protein PSTT_11884 [Puccinia striiformis]
MQNATTHYPPHQQNNITSLEHQHDIKSLSNHSSTDSKSHSIRYKTFHTAFGPLSINDFLRKDWIKYYVLLIILLIAVAIVANRNRSTSVRPIDENLKINGFEVGWVIPVAVLFIISFPPLFGHEVRYIYTNTLNLSRTIKLNHLCGSFFPDRDYLCGLVWGLWIGFAIVSVGTLAGELANYWAFKYACSHRAAKLEKKDVNYASRLSAIPGHLVTPVFATTGMSLFIFTAATVISMPKQLAGVYLGTLFNTSETEDGTADKSTGSKAVKYSVIGLTFIVTVVAALYIYRKMALARSSIQARPSRQDPGAGYLNNYDRQERNGTRTYEHAPSLAFHETSISSCKPHPPRRSVCPSTQTNLSSFPSFSFRPANDRSFSTSTSLEEEDEEGQGSRRGSEDDIRNPFADRQLKIHSHQPLPVDSPINSPIEARSASHPTFDLNPFDDPKYIHLPITDLPSSSSSSSSRTPINYSHPNHHPHHHHQRR